MGILDLPGGGGSSVTSLDHEADLPLAYFLNADKLDYTIDPILKWKYGGSVVSLDPTGNPSNFQFLPNTTGIPAGYTRCMRFAPLTVSGAGSSSVVFNHTDARILAGAKVRLRMRATNLNTNTTFRLFGYVGTALLTVTSDLTSFTVEEVVLDNPAGYLFFNLQVTHASGDAVPLVDILTMEIFNPSTQSGAPQDNAEILILNPKPHVVTFSRSRNNDWEYLDAPASGGAYTSTGAVGVTETSLYVDSGLDIAVPASGADIWLSVPNTAPYIYNQRGYESDYLYADNGVLCFFGFGWYSVSGEAQFQGLLPGDVVDLVWEGPYAGDTEPRVQGVCPPGQTSVQLRMDISVLHEQDLSSGSGLGYFKAHCYYSAASTRTINQYGLLAKRITGPDVPENKLSMAPVTGITVDAVTTAGSIAVSWTTPTPNEGTYMVFAVVSGHGGNVPPASPSTVRSGVVGTTASSATIAGLTAGQEYRVGVYRLSNDGRGSQVAGNTLVTVT